MILTCPQCATGYFVDDTDLARGGVGAHCAACGARWTPVSRPSAAAAAVPTNSPRQGPDAAPAALLTATPLKAGDLPKAFRARATSRRRLRQAALSGVAWGGTVAGLAFFAGAAVVFRVEVARAVPATAAIYAAAGMPVNRIGLVIEAVRAEPGLQDGHATLGVTGLIRNVEDRSVRAPPLRVELYNARGRAITRQIAGAGESRIPPGQTRPFAVAIFDPPLSAYNLQVAFAPEVRGRLAMARPLRRPTPPPPPAPPSLRGALSPEPPPAPAVAETAAPAPPHG